jgi:hypothetical protein
MKINWGNVAKQLVVLYAGLVVASAFGVSGPVFAFAWGFLVGVVGRVISPIFISSEDEEGPQE